MKLKANEAILMRFQTPQFIEIEDKIFGPLTLKQFIYLAGSGGTVFALYKLLPLFISVFFIIPIAGLGLALAFYTINNKPFIFTLEAAFGYLFSSKLYLWKKEPEKQSGKKKEEHKEEAPVPVPKLSESKLKDLAWSLDVQNARGDQNNK